MDGAEEGGPPRGRMPSNESVAALLAQFPRPLAPDGTPSADFGSDLFVLNTLEANFLLHIRKLRSEGLHDNVKRSPDV
eukprot:CAMPEP_0177785958 /NCGR_PEP_ID=MMETSP0491_2-20121128/20648_1 /TAXON_ID=63592 /ORGANISM="Tetraselmis chuii, Strain PLY429" /LENGTH=77 /DNA_ID=CAMNT_0019307099 /DNA_START=295 /DNA_END=528 /DNA_ORIENTATION=-